LLQSPAAKVASWWRRLLGLIEEDEEPANTELERPWLIHWDYLPRRSAGHGFSRADYVEARQRAREVAQSTLGAGLWELLQQQGHLDVPSKLFPGVNYRLRIGRRIEVVPVPGISPPWPQRYLCINPTYPLPQEEFFAQLYLYVRDREDIIVKVAAPQPWDQALGRTF